jgi:hypothetical protein
VNFNSIKNVLGPLKIIGYFRHSAQKKCFV